MPPSSVAARSLALALIGVGAASFAAHGQNVIAFNPYSGTGLPGGPVPQYRPESASPIVDTVTPGPTTGPAFNPWSLRGQTAGGTQFPVSASAATNAAPGAYLPPPPAGPITSRIVAVPELTTNAKSLPVQKPSATTVAPKPAPTAALARNAAPAATPAPTSVAKPVPKPESPVIAAPALVPAVKPAAAPPPVIAAPAPPIATPSAPVAAVPTSPAATPALKPAPAPPVVAAPAPQPAPPAVAAPATVATPAPPPSAPEQKMAALAPTPAPLPPAPSARAPLSATVAFNSRSAELSDASKIELDRVAKTIVDRSPRQIELRAFAGNGDPADRKISLARALIVRTYLIDKGVKSKIEVGAFAGDGNERVDILVPNT